MKAKLVIAALLLLTVSAGAHAQVAVSMGVDNALAHSCYMSALTSVKGNHRIAADGIGTCTAALADSSNIEVRAATYDNRGILYEATQDYASAWADFDLSIRLNANLGDAWLNRGVTQIRLKKPDQALGDIEHGMQLGLSMPEVGYYDRGVAEVLLGRAPEAYADFKRALAANPDFSRAADALKNFTVLPGPDGKTG